MKDKYCAYYTDSDDITSYMVSMLEIEDGNNTLEPSGGKGVFIDALLKKGKKINIDALDLDNDVIKYLKKKYLNFTNIKIRLADTLLDDELNWLGEYYDKIIGNPPYGAWQDYDKREMLKNIYNEYYIKETYTMFLLRGLMSLKYGGKLSFIVPETFLYLNRHEKLRRKILTNTKIKEILIFPSKFFPGVNFGYANLSIITVEKSGYDESMNNVFSIIRGFSSSEEFNDLLNNDKLEKIQLKQANIVENENSSFIITDSNTAKIISKTKFKLSDVSDIVTGFYTGNNKKFICAKDDFVKGAKKYLKIKNKLVVEDTSLKGISGIDEVYIPFVKSSSPTRYIRLEDEWFVRWDQKTVDFYVKDKKARFQNSQYYFKTGIAIPMVKSSCIRATLMKNRIFDQSIVGIFPKDAGNVYYLLALMNSNIINDLIHVINPTANNSSNYIKKIPYIEPSYSERYNIERNVKKILSLNLLKDSDIIEQLHNDNNRIINQIYGRIA